MYANINRLPMMRTIFVVLWQITMLFAWVCEKKNLVKYIVTVDIDIDDDDHVNKVL